MGEGRTTGGAQLPVDGPQGVVLAVYEGVERGDELSQMVVYADGGRLYGGGGAILGVNSHLVSRWVGVGKELCYGGCIAAADTELDGGLLRIVVDIPGLKGQRVRAWFETSEGVVNVAPVAAEYVVLVEIIEDYYVVGVAVEGGHDVMAYATTHSVDAQTVG